MQRVTRAVVLSAGGDSFELAPGPASLPLLQKNQLLVRMEFASVSLKDLATLREAAATGQCTQNVLGLTGSGTVIETGGRLKNWRFHGRRVCVFCCDSRLPGAWAEYLVVSSRYCYILEDAISLEQGACLFSTALTSSLCEEVLAKSGEKVALFTNCASNLGKSLIRVCNFRQILTVQVVSSPEDERELRDLGAIHFVRRFEADFSEKLTNICSELAISIAFDCFGGTIAGEIFNNLCPGGGIYLYEDGNSCEEVAGIDSRSLIFSKKRISGLNPVPWFVKKASIQQMSLIHHIQTHHYLHKSNIIGVYRMEEAASAVSQAEGDGRSGQVLLHLRAFAYGRPPHLRVSSEPQVVSAPVEEAKSSERGVEQESEPADDNRGKDTPTSRQAQILIPDPTQSHAWSPSERNEYKQSRLSPACLNSPVSSLSRLRKTVAMVHSVYACATLSR